MLLWNDEIEASESLYGGKLIPHNTWTEIIFHWEPEGH